MTVVYLQTKQKAVNGKMYGDLVYARALHWLTWRCRTSSSLCRTRGGRTTSRAAV